MILARAQRREVGPKHLSELAFGERIAGLHAEPVRGHRRVIIDTGAGNGSWTTCPPMDLMVGSAQVRPPLTDADGLSHGYPNGARTAQPADNDTAVERKAHSP